MYTTANDLARLVHRVLLSPTPHLLSSQRLKEWLSPLYVFHDRQTGVGYPHPNLFDASMPWEISLPSESVAHQLYSKAGAHRGHTSHLLLSPELSFAVIAFACGPSSNADALSLETERIVRPLLLQTLGEANMRSYAGIYRLPCEEQDNGEVIVEVDSQITITSLRDCAGKDIFQKIDSRCTNHACYAKLWPVGREGEFR
jgi:hypothetical protein